MNIKDFYVNFKTPVHNAVKKIDEMGKKSVFVVDDKERFIGLFTDGDMRRYILKNGDFSKPVAEAMQSNPICFAKNEENKALEILRKNKMIVVPIVDDKFHVVHAYFWNDTNNNKFIHKFTKQVPVVIMAGGKGTRLYPYTKILPKPLIPIGEIPITERIIQRFQAFGLNQFFMILNHKKNMIKAYFNELPKEYHLQYLEEEQFLGTGGGLSLLKGKLNSTFFVSNCDCLLDADYVSMYDHHKKQDNLITIVSAIKNVIVPYGVIETNTTGSIETIKEKPEFPLLINTGIYLVEPEVLNRLENNKNIDFPDIVKQLMQEGLRVGTYPITEKSWLDMGQIEEMNHMIKTLGLDNDIIKSTT